MKSQDVITMGILVVEDDLGTCQLLVEAFDSQGYRAYSFENGAEALAYFAKPHPKIDLIFLDTMMPVMDGFQFRAEQMKDKMLAQIPTIIYSANYDNRQKAVDLGLEFLEKPLDLNGLFVKVGRMLGGAPDSVEPRPII
jgi:CheY-like chemotaxis protein